LLVPKRDAKRASDPYNAEPRDEVLNRQFERQAVKAGALSVALEAAREASPSDLSARLDRLIVAAQANDWATFSLGNQSLGYGDAGRNMLERGAEQANWLERHAAQQQVMPVPTLLQPTSGSIMQH
jgi:hypothetical protein